MNKLHKYISNILSTSRYFGLRYSILYHVIGKFKGFHYKQSVISNFLKKEFKEHLIILDHTYTHDSLTPIEKDAPIWVCWFQGEEQMPRIVQACYHSILQNASTHPVHLITMDNYATYVTLPDHIIQKLNSGIITLTHFSDILRVSLLAKYGGAWMDATILLSNKIDFEEASFFSLKQYPIDSLYVSNYRWTGFFMAGGINNTLFIYLSDLLFFYWENFDKLIDYLLLDYLIHFLYDNKPSIKKMIDSVPYNNQELYFLQKNTNMKFEEKRYTDLCKKTFIHKLTWKKEFIEVNSDGLPTYYHHLLQNNK